MTTFLSDWTLFLHRSGGILGVILLIAGLSVMLFGWRLARPLIAISFLATGFAAVMLFTAEESWRLTAAIGSGLAIGGLCYWQPRFATALAAGLIASGGTSAFLTSTFSMHGPLLLASAAVALLAGLGGGLIYDKIVTILITAFEGAVLLVSGVSAIVMDWPWLYSYLHSMVLGSAFVLPFCLLVPTIVASFYQMADVRRSQAPH
ncbi:MAG: hypothetical protein IID36_05895 [Planctomycetes bacterium]|nr:hypothetical protein [Planctomycetota bacterium]